MFEQHEQAEVDALIQHNAEFRSLYHRHRELDGKVRDAELGVLAVDDVTLLNMKKEKLHAKDRLTQLWALCRRASGVVSA
ncbi:MAG: YdcH family protein [Lysobacterales bacterium]